LRNNAATPSPEGALNTTYPASSPPDRQRAQVRSTPPRRPSQTSVVACLMGDLGSHVLSQLRHTGKRITRRVLLPFTYEIHERRDRQLGRSPPRACCRNTSLVDSYLR